MENLIVLEITEFLNLSVDYLLLNFVQMDNSGDNSLFSHMARAVFCS